MWAAERCKQESHNCLLLSNGVSQHGADESVGGKHGNCNEVSANAIRSLHCSGPPDEILNAVFWF